MRENLPAAGLGVVLLAATGCGVLEYASPGPSADGGPADVAVPGREAAPTDVSSEGGACPDGGRTSISGRVYDPAAVNPLFNVQVFVPVEPLAVFPSGPSCSCLFEPSGPGGVTDAKGSFFILDPPPGASVPLVVQAGKWRMEYRVRVAQCQDNPQPDKALRLPRTHSEGDLPQIAVSTGGEDSLECMLLRMGVAPSEFVGGAGTPDGGHVHVFSGRGGAMTAGATSPDPAVALWDSAGDIMPYDDVLLSCEGAETAHLDAAGQQVLLGYAGSGGRVFASHFHYAWFDTGPFAAASPPLTTWTTGPQPDHDAISGTIATLLGNGRPFPDGIELKQWLGSVGALDDGGLPLRRAHDNAQVTPANTASQIWVAADQSSSDPGAAQVFSFDAPLGMAPKCGRVVYADLDVSGGPMNPADPNTDYPDAGPPRDGGAPGIVPDQCGVRPLTPQEKALEFMLFDLPFCITP